MNQAILKSTKVNTEKQNGNLNFKWKSTSIEEDVLAMIAAGTKAPPKVRVPKQPTDKDKVEKSEQGNLPPFARHYKDGAEGNKYKAGDTKVHDGITWHFCDFPDHNTRIKWHKFAVGDCKARKAWLAKKGSDDDTPACDRNLLDNDPSGTPHSYAWNYRSVVGSLSYLQAMVRPDLTMAVQQCARFCNNPQQQHATAVKRICRYLLKTKDRGLIMRPDKTRGLECYVDADWAGSWQHRSCHDPTSARSRTGYVIMYAGCPIVWALKMHTLVALSTTEAEYIALSSALREVIGIMHLMREIQSRGFDLNLTTPEVRCTVFEDNQSCIEIATNHRTRPRTKHLSVRLHHFRSHILAKTISVRHISTKEQLADMFTKPLPRDQFAKLRNRFMGWGTLDVRE